MKEQVTKFDLNTAFKALSDIPMPTVKKGPKPNKFNYAEALHGKQHTDILLEDYYDVNSQEDLGEAKAERDGEVAKAKLARIEKIVDLNAETEEDILPSYVGKFIIQCPQCMQMFYKDEADITKSEEDPNTVNVGEQCPNCNNDQGFDLIGKVGAVEEDEMAGYTDDDLNLDFDEPVEEAEEDEYDLDVEEEEPVEEEPAEEEKLDLDIEEEDEEEKKEESFTRPVGETLVEQIEEAVSNAKVLKFENHEFNPEWLYIKADEEGEKKVKDLGLNPDELATDCADDDCCYFIVEPKMIKESLTESADEDLNKKLEAHNRYIAHVQEKIAAAEKELAEEKNEEIKKLIEKTINAYKEELESALPEAVKDEQQAEDLPDADEVDLEEVEDVEVEESLDEKVCPKCGKEVDEPCEDCQKELKEAKKQPTEEETFDNNYIDDACYYLFHEPHYFILEGDWKNRADEIIKKYNEKHPKDTVKKETKDSKVVLSTQKWNGKLDEAQCKLYKAMTHPDEDMKELNESCEAKRESFVEACLREEDLLPAEPTEADYDDLFDSKEFNTPVSEADVEAAIEATSEVEEAYVDDLDIDNIDDIDDDTLNEAISNYLTETYENVKGFETTGCTVDNSSLIIEGHINFNSGKVRDTNFKFNVGNVSVFEGFNKDLSEDKTFKLNCRVDGNRLFTESLKVVNLTEEAEIYEGNGTNRANRTFKNKPIKIVAYDDKGQPIKFKNTKTGEVVDSVLAAVNKSGKSLKDAEAKAKKIAKMSKVKDVRLYAEDAQTGEYRAEPILVYNHEGAIVTNNLKDQTSTFKSETKAINKQKKADEKGQAALGNLSFADEVNDNKIEEPEANNSEVTSQEEKQDEVAVNIEANTDNNKPEETVEANVEPKVEAEPKVEVNSDEKAKGNNARLNLARERNKKIANALKDVDVKQLYDTKKNIKGKDYQKATPVLNRIRKEIFGENIDIEDLDKE